MTPEPIVVFDTIWSGRLYFEPSSTTEYVVTLRMLGSSAQVLIEYNRWLGEERNVWESVPELPEDAAYCDSRNFKVSLS